MLVVVVLAVDVVVVVLLSLLGERVGGGHGTVERREVVETGLVGINVVSSGESVDKVFFGDFFAS